jgi:hypothetical protein
MTIADIMSAAAFVIIMIAMLNLFGCSSNKPIQVAYNCPQLELPPDPPVSVRSLTSASKPDMVLKSWVSMATNYYEWNQVVHAEVESSR